MPSLSPSRSQESLDLLPMIDWHDTPWNASPDLSELTAMSEVPQLSQKACQDRIAVRPLEM